MKMGRIEVVLLALVLQMANAVAEDDGLIVPSEEAYLQIPVYSGPSLAGPRKQPDEVQPGPVLGSVPGGSGGSSTEKEGQGTTETMPPRSGSGSTSGYGSTGVYGSLGGYSTSSGYGSAGGSSARRPFVPDSAVTLIDFLPPVGNQTKKDCVAWACGYASMSCQIAQERHRKPEADYDRFSPVFIFEQLPKRGGTIDILQAMAFLKTTGCATCATAPDYGNIQMDQARKEAAVYKASTFERLKNLDQIRDCIEAKYPVTIVISQDSDFYQGKIEGSPDSYIYRWDGLSDQDYKNGNNNYPKHAVTVVGYDDKRAALLIMNSHGVHWKDQGFCWVSYDELTEDSAIGNKYWCQQAYVLRAKKDAQINVTIPSSTPTAYSRQFARWSYPGITTVDARTYTLKGNDLYSLGNSEPFSPKNWKVADITANDKLLFAYITNTDRNPATHSQQEVVKIFENKSWTYISKNWDLQSDVTMIAAAPSSPLFVLTEDLDLLEYQDGPGTTKKVELPTDALPVDLRTRTIGSNLNRKVFVTTANGEVYGLNDGQWQKQ